MNSINGESIVADSADVICDGNDNCMIRCDSYSCDYITITCPQNDPYLCVIDCDGIEACKNAKINWSPIAGNNQISCKMESSCAGIEFPIPHPNQTYTLNCNTNAIDICSNTTIYCPTNADCTINCDSSAGYSCENMTIYGPIDHVLTVNCDYEAACYQSTIYAQYASQFNLGPCEQQEYVCVGLDIYIPPNDVDGKPVAFLAGDDSLSGGDGSPAEELNLYAINGFLDTDFSAYSGSYQFNVGSMYCGYDYEFECPLRRLGQGGFSWECFNDPICESTQHTSATPTTSNPTTSIPTSTPTMTPTIEPTTSNPSTSPTTPNPTQQPTPDTSPPTFIPTTEPITTYPPTNEPSIEPTMEPTVEPTEDSFALSTTFQQSSTLISPATNKHGLSDLLIGLIASIGVLIMICVGIFVAICCVMKTGNNKRKASTTKTTKKKNKSSLDDDNKAQTDSKFKKVTSLSSGSDDHDIDENETDMIVTKGLVTPNGQIDLMDDHGTEFLMQAIMSQKHDQSANIEMGTAPRAFTGNNNNMNDNLLQHVNNNNNNNILDDNQHEIATVPTNSLPDSVAVPSVMNNDFDMNSFVEKFDLDNNTIPVVPALPAEAEEDDFAFEPELPQDEGDDDDNDDDLPQIRDGSNFNDNDNLPPMPATYDTVLPAVPNEPKVQTAGFVDDDSSDDSSSSDDNETTQQQIVISVNSDNDNDNDEDGYEWIESTLKKCDANEWQQYLNNFKKHKMTEDRLKHNPTEFMWQQLIPEMGVRLEFETLWKQKQNILQ